MPGWGSGAWGVSAWGGSGYEAAVSENAQGADQAAGSVVLNAAVQESAQGQDSTAASYVVVTQVAESAQVSDLTTATAGFIASLAEQAQGGDQFVASHGVAASVSEGAGVLDAFSAQQGFLCEISETVDAVPLALVIGAIQFVDINEQATGSDTAQVTNDLNAAVTEAAGVDESYAARVDFVSSVSSTAQGLDRTRSNVKFVAKVQERVLVFDRVTGRFLWEVIDTAQNPDWQVINTAQSANWRNI